MSIWLIHVHRTLGKPTTKIHCSALCLPQLGFALHCRISEQVHTCCRIRSLPSHPGSLSHSLSHHHHPPLSLPILHFGIWHQIFLCSYSNLPMFVCLYIVFANKYLFLFFYSLSLPFTPYLTPSHHHHHHPTLSLPRESSQSLSPPIHSCCSGLCTTFVPRVR